ncbi:MAG: argininosuccinate synthase domain-containing protein [Vicinamibacterales bacterium]
MDTIVLAYAGGPAARAAVPWLRQTCGAAVVTVTLDIGQERDLAAVRDQALAAGAARAHVVDRRDAFMFEFLLPALKADADLGPSSWTVLAWPLLAQTLVDIAVMEDAGAVAHACPDGPSSTQLEAAVRALGPDLMVIAAGEGTGERAAVNTSSAEYRTAGNSMAPGEPALVDVAFARGVPTALNGIDMPLPEMLATLSTIAGAYGPSRAVSADDDGLAVASLSMAPAMAVLQAAHLSLRQLVTDERLGRFCEVVGREYGAIALDGLWFTPMRRALDGFADEIQSRATGTVRLKLSAGGVEQVSATSAFARAADTRRQTNSATRPQPLST